MSNKTLAKFFYEQCAGTYKGHMSMVPNNPVIFGLVKAHSEVDDDLYAINQTKFAQMLRDMAEVDDDLYAINQTKFAQMLRDMADDLDSNKLTT